MAVVAHITRISLASADWPKLLSGEGLGVMPGHEGDAITLDFDAGVANGPVAASDGIYEISIDGADARVKIGENAVATGANGQFWFDGRTDLRLVRKDQRISVIKA